MFPFRAAWGFGCVWVAWGTLPVDGFVSREALAGSQADGKGLFEEGAVVVVQGVSITAPIAVPEGCRADIVVGALARSKASFDHSGCWVRVVQVGGTPALVALFVIPDGMYDGGSDTWVMEEGDVPVLWTRGGTDVEVERWGAELNDGDRQ